MTTAHPAEARAQDCSLGVFLRVPKRGGVKTRLAAQLGVDAALALYEAFVEDTARLCSACAPALDTTLWLDGAPGSRLPLEEPQLPFARREQSAGGLGARLAHALCAALQVRSRALVIGSDSPSLPAGYLTLAASSLQAVPLVLGPAVDGGFYLIGARRELAARLWPLLGQVRWSTPHALSDTCAAARAQGIELRLLPPWFDVDDGLGLSLLRLQLGRCPEAAPASARCLAELDRTGLLTWPVGS